MNRTAPPLRPPIYIPPTASATQTFLLGPVDPRRAVSCQIPYVNPSSQPPAHVTVFSPSQSLCTSAVPVPSRYAVPQNSERTEYRPDNLALRELSRTNPFPKDRGSQQNGDSIAASSARLFLAAEHHSGFRIGSRRILRAQVALPGFRK